MAEEVLGDKFVQVRIDDFKEMFLDVKPGTSKHPDFIALRGWIELSYLTP